jgi:hypothetical protein
MSERNGPDIAAVYQLLSQVAQMVTEHGHILTEHVDILTEHGRVLAEQGRKLDEQGRVLTEQGRILTEQGRKLDDLAAGQAWLREALTFYHSAVIGHGISITELDKRVKRIERHLNLEPTAR